MSRKRPLTAWDVFTETDSETEPCAAMVSSGNVTSQESQGVVMQQGLSGSFMADVDARALCSEGWSAVLRAMLAEEKKYLGPQHKQFRLHHGCAGTGSVAVVLKDAASLMGRL